MAGRRLGLAVEIQNRALLRQGRKIFLQHSSFVFHEALKKNGTQQCRLRLAIKLAIGRVRKRDLAVGLKPADQIRLVGHDRAQAFFIFNQFRQRLPPRRTEENCLPINTKLAT